MRTRDGDDRGHTHRPGRHPDDAPGVPVVADIVANDIGIVGAPEIVAQPLFGTATFNPDGTLLYTPGPQEVGIAVIAYRICSPTASDVCDSATVHVAVPPR